MSALLNAIFPEKHAVPVFLWAPNNITANHAHISCNIGNLKHYCIRTKMTGRLAVVIQYHRQAYP